MKILHFYLTKVQIGSCLKTFENQSACYSNPEHWCKLGTFVF